MTLAISTAELTPEEVERASERDGKLYELVDGELKEKKVGFESLFIATRIVAVLNAFLYPREGAAAVEVMLYCFRRKRHGRKPDVTYIRANRFPEGSMPKGDIYIPPDLVVEVLSPGNSGIEVEAKLDEYLTAGIPLVWIVNPEGRTIRVYRNDGTTRVYRGAEAIENDPLLPGFRLVADEIFPVQPPVATPAT